MAKSLLNKLGFRRNEGISKFKNLDAPPQNASNLPGFEGIFWSNEGTVVHKWHHYLPIYEKYFSPYRDASPKFLEIGVSKGGSLALWRRYFGSKATIFGIDRDQACQALDGECGQVRIGSQDDPDFLKNVVSEMGGVDIILDDGSHISKHIRASLQTLFPLLSEGGVYMIEDLHATYWKSHHGGYQDSSSFMNDIRQMYDDMHHWYHSEGQKINATANNLYAIHLYDSIAVFEKNEIEMPKHSRVGSKS